MNLQSCQNCWFNGLQFGALGLPVGYCTHHRKILNFSDGTTCGMQIRKDLSLVRASKVATVHSKVFVESKIVRWMDNAEVDADSSDSERDLDTLRRDAVGNAVSDYGHLDSKIESLSQLWAIKTARSDVALTSLARAYVNNCVNQGGRWTSGIHLYWWIKTRLVNVPDVAVDDLRFVGSTQLARQTELTSWSIMMFRLSFVDDIVEYAGKENDEIGRAKGLLNEAAMAVTTFNVRKLRDWIQKEAIPLLDSRLNRNRYSKLARELHKESGVSDA
jgi:hypothetical protein